MDDRDTLEERSRMEPLAARLDRACGMIRKMCSEGRRPEMSIPVDYLDEDFHIILAIKDAKEEIDRLRAELDALRNPPGELLTRTTLPDGTIKYGATDELMDRAAKAAGEVPPPDLGKT